MQYILSVSGLILFICLILVHEWGHYIAARRNGVDVEEYGLGFPPRAWGKKLKSGMVLSINWLPLGGFVKLKGEHDSDRRKGSFGAASLPAKIRIMSAGVTLNLLVGILMLILLALTGMPKAIDNQFTVVGNMNVTRQETWVGYIDKNSPAQKAGVKFKDQITQITCLTCQPASTTDIKTADQLRAATKSYAGQTVKVSLIRDKQPLEVTTQLNSKQDVEASIKAKNQKGYFGVAPVELEQRRYTWAAPVVAIGFTGQLAKLTIQGLGSAVSGLGKTIAGLATANTTARQKGQAQATAQTGGIVAIVNIIWSTGSLGTSYMLMIIAVLSLTLALMNILPIPALDGGRIFVTLLFAAMRKPLTRATEDRIHGTGMAVLLSLFLLITIVDVRRFY